MFKLRSRSFAAAVAGLLLAASTSTAHAQDAQQQTPMARQLSRISLALEAPFELTKTSNGHNFAGPVQDNPSESVGGLATIRYIKSPLIGAEMNYRFTKATQNYTYPFVMLPGTSTTPTYLGVQASEAEISWGYVAHTPNTYYGLQPFGGAGLGTLEYKPTRDGGQGLQRQFRALYYWNLGADYQILGSHFGVRAQVRQLFYIAPDFQQSYLKNGARTTTLEPTIGFYANF